MITYLIIKADTNDADFVYSVEKNLSKEQIRIAKKASDAIKKFQSYKGKGLYCREDIHHHNFPNGESAREDLGEKTLEELYVKTGHLTSKDLDIFLDLCPYGEYGIHTIHSILIINVEEENYLYNSEDSWGFI